MRGLALLATLLGGCLAGDDALPPVVTGPVPSTTVVVRGTDYPDGAVLRFRVTDHQEVGSFECGFRQSWTWRYLSNAALVPAGPAPRADGPELEFDAERHEFTAHWDTVGPIGTRTEQVRMFQGGSFTYSTWVGGLSEYDMGCATFLSGVVEVVE